MVERFFAELWSLNKKGVLLFFFIFGIVQKYNIQHHQLGNFHFLHITENTQTSDSQVTWFPANYPISPKNNCLIGYYQATHVISDHSCLLYDWNTGAKIYQIKLTYTSHGFLEWLWKHISILHNIIIWIKNVITDFEFLELPG